MRHERARESQKLSETPRVRYTAAGGRKMERSTSTVRSDVSLLFDSSRTIFGMRVSRTSKAMHKQNLTSQSKEPITLLASSAFDWSKCDDQSNQRRIFIGSLMITYLKVQADLVSQINLLLNTSL